MDYRNATLDYYSKWLGRDSILSSFSKGSDVFYSKERDAIQYGYSKLLSLWIWKDQKRLLISYGESAKKGIMHLKNVTPEISSEELKKQLKTIYGVEVSHGVKYLYQPTMEIKSDAFLLSKAQYPEYLEFFMQIHPNCGNTNWLKEYFENMVDAGLCCGVMKQGILVSCTDAPGMPFLGERVQEIGINTIPAERGNGYAQNACALCVRQIIRSGKCPQWSTDIQNKASQKLAEKLGFRRFGEFFTLSL